MRLTFSEFCRAVSEVVDSLPEELAPYLNNVVVDVFQEPGPSDQRPSDWDADRSSGELLGLFVGVPLTEQSHGHHHMNVVKIFRGPLERVSRNRDALLQNIRATILHEFAHHFGFSEADLERFERSQAKWLPPEFDR